jgi:quercetin dioxygenase-like cupin family protein
MEKKVNGFVLAPGEGRQIRVGPNQVTVKVSPESGGHLMGMFESELPPRSEAFAHRHHRFEEAFYVLSGEIEYLLDDQRITATAGSYVFVPPGVIHGFKNVGSANARHLVICAPVELLNMIEGVGKANTDAAEVMARYDSELIKTDRI